MTEQDLPNSHEERKESYLREHRKREKRHFSRTVIEKTDCRKNKLNTGEDRMSHRMRRSRKIRTDCQS